MRQDIHEWHSLLDTVGASGSQCSAGGGIAVVGMKRMNFKRCFLLGVLFLSFSGIGQAQQFSGDNQWVAPYGVGTFVATVGEEYSQLYAIASLVPEWEFNAQFTFYYDDPRDNTESYTASSFYVKRRLKENEAQTSGYAFLAGTGLFPEHVEHDEVNAALDSWWAMGVATYSFADDRVLWDILPGVTYNTNRSGSSKNAWGFTYSTRLAIYDVIPQSAIVAEVFGTAGEAYAKPNYRVGVRWESPKVIVAATYADAFDGSGGAGFEIGVMYLTDAIFCIRSCSR